MKRFVTLLFSLFLSNLIACASMIVPLTVEEQVRGAVAICRGVVVGSECLKSSLDGRIYTRTHLRVDEVLKGKFPTVVTLVHRGGLMGREGEDDGSSPRFNLGDERLLFLSRRADGTLFALQGAASAPKLTRSNGTLSVTEKALLHRARSEAHEQKGFGGDVTDQMSPAVQSLPATTLVAASPISMATNLLSDGSGVSARFIAPDRAEPIPYLVDADILPNGMTLDSALLAVRQALSAWSNVTTLRFTFEGVTSFGTTAANVDADDGKLRIQLHDLYSYIPEPQVLGKGGRAYHTSPPDVSTWGFGGKVGNSEFHRTIAGYVTLKHTAPSMQSLATFAEVLCHEIGHALSMAHSSENPNESWTDWREAIMYFRAHGDDRGATLGAYDVRVVGQSLPQGNTPPYSYDRVMDIVTQDPGAPNVAGINEVEARGYDLQSTNLILQTAGSSTTEFGVIGNRIKYTPLSPYNAPRIDPADGPYYDVIYFRHSDGTNASALASVRALSFQPDAFPSDGMPNTWMTTHFGTTAGDGPRAPGADFDGDGVTNLEEYILGTDPTNALSNLRVISFGLSQFQFQAKPYELYEVYGSADLVNWARVINPVLPTNAPGIASGYAEAPVARRFLRVLKVQ
jgi:hypothetical protein